MKIQHTLALMVFVISIYANMNNTVAQERLWVASDRIARHTCPSVECGIVGQLIFRENVSVLETNGIWVRVTNYYDASCTDGISAYVDSGNNTCTTNNGLRDGKFAEWILVTDLVAVQPADPAEEATGYEEIVKQSDDFRKHRVVFARAARDLIASGQCTTNDFQEMGGWMKSTSNYKSQPVYFTYCGGFSNSNRVYLDASNGRTFR